jgi:hypothetical protein
MVEVVAEYVDGSGNSKPPIDTNAAILLPPKEWRSMALLI